MIDERIKCSVCGKRQIDLRLRKGTYPNQIDFCSEKCEMGNTRVEQTTIRFKGSANGS